jgi:hypothetical protein
MLLVQLRSMNIAQIDCFPAYCVERVTVAFVYDCSPVAAKPVRSLLFWRASHNSYPSHRGHSIESDRCRTRSGNSFYEGRPVPEVLALPRASRLCQNWRAYSEATAKLRKGYGTSSPVRSRITVQEWIFRLWQSELSRYDDVVEYLYGILSGLDKIFKLFEYSKPNRCNCHGRRSWQPTLPVDSEARQTRGAAGG